MEDKLHWMYGFWIMLSTFKSIQGFLRLAADHRNQLPFSTQQLLFTAFWTIAAIFYAYAIWRKLHPRPRTHDRRKANIVPAHKVI